MKKTGFAIVILIVTALTASCHKDDGESIVDCFGESLFLDAHHSVSTENPLLVNLSVSYSGSHAFDNSIKWDFGDGTPVQTSSGMSTTHTYAANGNYTVKATVTLNGGSCSYTLNETVNLE